MESVSCFQEDDDASIKIEEDLLVLEGPSSFDIELECECAVCDLMEKGISHYKFIDQKQIISKGRPTPPLTNLTKQTKSYVRHFQKENYKNCEWLTGCDNKSLLFCWPCVLFSTEKNVWNKSGFSDLNNLHKLIKRHSSSQAHLHAIIKEKTFGKTITAEQPATNNRLPTETEAHNREVRKNREILKRLIDVVCFLGERELSFRGHSETGQSSSKGNYVDLVNFLAKYDEVLKYHLENSARFKGTSNLIQNDLILCVEKIVLKKIKSEVEDASFVAIIMDEITDVANNINQLSTVLRYVTKNGEIKERFIGFLNVPTQRTASALYDIVQTIMNDYDCGSKFAAQSYDAPAVMPGELEELQTKLKQTYPSALFVHYTSHHRLNLALQRSLNTIKECKIFFQILSGLSTFLSKSPKRTGASDGEVFKKFPKLGTAQWNYNGKVVKTIFQFREPLIEFFHNIMDNQEKWDNETIVSSRGYLSILETDENFNFLLIIFSEIFPFCDNLSTILQNNTSNINFCIKHIQKFQSIVLSKKKQFDDFWAKFEQFQTIIQPQKKRIRLDTDEEHTTDQKSKLHNLFFEIIANISSHLDTRFKNFENLRFLELANFCDKHTVNQKALNSLKQNYAQYFDFHALSSELAVIYNISGEINKTSASELRKSLKEWGLDRACPEIIKLCELTLTIPATSASADRSLSALKRVKNFVKNSTGQERLSALGLIAIEKELVQKSSSEKSFYDDVIDEFAKENRRMVLDFK